MTKKIFSTVIAFIMASSVFVNLTYADIQDSSNVSASEVARALRDMLKRLLHGAIQEEESTINNVADHFFVYSISTVCN